MRGESERAERDGDLAKAAELRYGRIPEIEKKLDAALPTAQAQTDVMLKEEVGPDDIADVVAAWTGIPAGRLLEGETAKLLRMEDELGKRVIGQNAAVHRRLRCGPSQHAPGSPTPTGRPDRSCSSGRRASARPSWPRRWRTSCSTTSGRWSAST